jgi:hypothetical protein
VTDRRSRDQQAEGTMNLSRIMIAAAFALLSFTGAHAQSNPIVGLWSTSLYGGYGPGQAFGVLYFSFFPDGSCRQRFIVRQGGTPVDYICRYQLSPDGSVLRYTLIDYTPKLLPPTMRIGSNFTAQMQWQNQSNFILMDASGPMQFVRQR